MLSRQPFLDLARAFALFGIAPVNVMLFAYPAATGYADGGLSTAADRLAWFAVNALFTFKAYTVFALMFGAGFAIQMDAAARVGQGFGARYARRMFGLLVLGVLNIAALFYGDILVLYAALGTLLYGFRHAPARQLWRWGTGIYVLQIATVVVLALALQTLAEGSSAELQTERAALQRDALEAREAFASAGFARTAAFRIETYLEGLGGGVLLQGLGAFAFLMFGFAALRSGLLGDPSAAVWSRCRRWCLPAGLLLSGWGAWLSIDADPLEPNTIWGLAVLTLASPLSTAGYLGLVALWAARPPSALRAFLERAGSASLSAYLLQGLLLSLVFSGYGLGLHAQLGAAACTAIAIAAALVSLVLTSLWRASQRYGPFEALLRAWTYLGSTRGG